MPSDTFVVIKVFPSEPGKEDGIEAEVRKIEIGTLKDVKKEPIAFGLVALRFGFIIPEGQEELAEKLSEEIKKIEDVNDVQIEGMTLL